MSESAPEQQTAAGPSCHTHLFITLSDAHKYGDLCAINPVPYRKCFLELREEKHVFTEQR